MPLRIVVPESPAAAATRDATTLHYRQLQYPLTEDELLTLRQMRLASGTYYDRIPTWLEEMRTGARLMWFIHLGPPTTTSTSPRHAHHQPKQESSPVSPGNLSFILNPQPHSHSQLQSQVTQREQAWTQPTPEKTWALTPAIAMVCLLTSNPSDPSLASPHTRRFELTSLWIYPAYRSNGVGASIIKQMEYEAAQRGAEYVTFNTSAGYGAPPTPSSVQNSPTHPSNYLVPSATATTTANAQAATGHSSSNNNSNNAALATLRTFERIGYNEYKPREHRYSINDVVNAGLPIESTLAAFFEKYVGRPRPYTSTSNSSGGSGSSGPSLKGQVSV